MSRVALQVGTARVRVAVDEGRPVLAAELPVSAAAGKGPVAAVPTVLGELFGGPVDELLVVHPVGRCPAAEGGLARVVRTVPAAVAAVAGIEASTGPGERSNVDGRVRREPRPGGAAVPDTVVVDVGHGGTEVALVRAGRVTEVRRAEVGGAHLDALTADLLGGAAPGEARRVREALSLLPAVRARGVPGVLDAFDLRAALAVPLQSVVDAVRAVLALAGRAPPVLLIGGVARTPLLAELLDAAGVNDVRVAPRPDCAAVLGALRLPPSRAGPSPAGPTNSTAEEHSAPWLPPVAPSRHRRSRMVLGTLATAAGAAGLAAVGGALPARAPDPGPSAGHLVQYGYAIRLPPGWAHTGGLPERRRSLLTPLATPDGSDLISVERTPLGYDGGAEPRRARRELRAEFASAVAAGAPLSGFDDSARFAGRPVVTYREAGGGEDGQVDWYVVLDGDAQLSIGCQHTPAGTDAVATACATVVASARRVD
jgi:type VII secretion-associated protein (TIGR03931 family)